MERSRPDLELPDVAAFLNARYGGSAGRVTALGGGDWSAAFSFRLDQVELIARFSALKEDFENDLAASEFAGPDLPVPCVLETGEFPSGYYAISKREHGVFLEELDETGWSRVLPQLLRALDSMRATEGATGSGCQLVEGRPGPATWREWLLDGIADRPGGRISGWRDLLARSAELYELFSSGESSLVSLLEHVPEQRSLVHGDLINRNVLVEPEGSRLVAVLDWGCAVFGDYLYDVAWLKFWSPWFPALDEIDFTGAVRSHYRSIGHDVDNFDLRLKAYELHIALSHLAYNAFAGRVTEQIALSDRMRQVLTTPA